MPLTDGYRIGETARRKARHWLNEGDSQWTSASTTATAPAWTIWVRTYDTDSGTTAGTSVYGNWTNAITTNASSITSTVFGGWTDSWKSTEYQRRYDKPRSRVLETPEQKAARAAAAAAAAVAAERRAAVWREEQAAQARKREAANARAKRLLQMVLNEQQNRDLAAHGHFFVKSQLGNLYRIDPEWSGNVKRIDPATGEWTERLCAHQEQNVPVHDLMLIQKLLLETAEAAFRKTANITFRHGGNFIGGVGRLTGQKLAEVIPFRQAA